MARSVFYSFHYKRDVQRVARIRSIGAIEGQTVLASNQWEEVKRGGEPAIQAWIDKEMKGKSCLVVLAGYQTAGRKWVNYEIKKAWKDGKGLLAIHIHNLVDLNGNRDPKGKNPFETFTLGDRQLASVVKTYDPPYTNSADVYNYIRNNVEGWVEEAITIRKNN